MKNIITIQHTQSEQHVNRMIGSWTDWPLTELGIEQARSIGRHLARELHDKPVIMISSDLLRARQTAEIIAAQLAITPTYTAALREFNLGAAIGHSKAWAKEHLQCPVWSGTIDWPAELYDIPFPGAESRHDVCLRVSSFLDQITAMPDENILIVSHDGTLSLLFALWLRLDPVLLNTRLLSGKTGGVSFLHADSDDRRSISRLNDLSYLSYD